MSTIKISISKHFNFESHTLFCVIWIWLHLPLHAACHHSLNFGESPIMHAAPLQSTIFTMIALATILASLSVLIPISQLRRRDTICMIEASVWFAWKFEFLLILRIFPLSTFCEGGRWPRLRLQLEDYIELWRAINSCTFLLLWHFDIFFREFGLPFVSRLANSTSRPQTTICRYFSSGAYWDILKIPKAFASAACRAWEAGSKIALLGTTPSKAILLLASQ